MFDLLRRFDVGEPDAAARTRESAQPRERRAGVDVHRDLSPASSAHLDKPRTQLVALALQLADDAAGLGGNLLGEWRRVLAAFHRLAVRVVSRQPAGADRFLVE